MSRIAFTALVLVAAAAGAARADIYSSTAADGSVTLSNMPIDDRSIVLVPSEDRPPAALPAARGSAGGDAGYRALIEQVALASGLDSALLRAVVSVESRYNPKAVSKKGAMGLMQLMPATARRYGVADAFDPLQNLQGGAQYLKDLLRLFGNNLELALAAYNAGEGAVMKHGNRIPPYDETRRYVPQVLDFYQRFQAAATPA